MKILFEKSKELFEKYERFGSAVALIFGFALDNFTLRRIDLWVENLAILGYLFIAGASILFLNSYDAGKLRGRFFDFLSGAVPFFMQFSFGGLFSVFFVFYARSGSFIASWPFLIILFSLLVGNELFRKKYERFVFHMSVYYLAIYAYAVLAVPVVLRKIGADIFVLSGAASLITMAIFFLFTFLAAPKRFLRRWKMLLGSVCGIFLVFNILYFTNTIPPVPLSLKEGGIYHSIEKSGSNYIISYEDISRRYFYKDYNPVFHWTAGSPIYCYAAIFAPTKLNTVIYHKWSFFDEDKREWLEQSRIRYSIIGGRDGGYRGWSVKSTGIKSGKWRVDVMTERGQILGRMNFTVVGVEEKPDLEIMAK